MAKPAILVPLYIYPLKTAWEPLLESAQLHPEVQFVAIINPSSGPGNTALPDASYVAVLSRLSGIPNIRPVGYTTCRYGQRTLDDIRGDVDLYRGWNAKFRLDGMFFDETPSDADFVHFMAALAEYTKTTWDTSLGRAGLVVYNPGVVVDQAFFEHPDYIVVLEDSEQQWNNYFMTTGLPRIATAVRSKSVVLIHSARSNETETLAKQILSLGLQGVFVTDQMGGGYSQWPAGWKRLVETVAKHGASA